MSPVHVWLGAISLQFVTRHFYCGFNRPGFFFAWMYQAFLLCEPIQSIEFCFLLPLKKLVLCELNAYGELCAMVTKLIEMANDGIVFDIFLSLSLSHFFRHFILFIIMKTAVFYVFFCSLHFSSLCMSVCVCVCFGSYQWENKRPIAFIEMAREKNS